MKAKAQVSSNRDKSKTQVQAEIHQEGGGE